MRGLITEQELTDAFALLEQNAADWERHWPDPNACDGLVLSGAEAKALAYHLKGLAVARKHVGTAQSIWAIYDEHGDMVAVDIATNSAIENGAALMGGSVVEGVFLPKEPRETMVADVARGLYQEDCPDKMWGNASLLDRGWYTSMARRAFDAILGAPEATND